MLHIRLLALLALLLSLEVVSAQEPITLAERFDPSVAYRVELKVRLAGRLAVPVEKGKPPQILPMVGNSTLTYDERPLPAEEANTARVMRNYREVDLQRTLDGKEQKAEIRPAVRRMVVMRSDKGKKAPFSPDGPLMWGEIDVVRTDLFSPVLVPGLLPTRAVRPGDRWSASAGAVAELTDFDPIEQGGLTVEFAGLVTLEGRRYAKLLIAGTVTGNTQDGPSRQKLDGMAYFDLDIQRLAYLNLTGRHELLGPGNTTVGRIDGTFVLTRGPVGRIADLTDEALRGLDLRPTSTNTELLYDNPDLGIRFNYPRRWRVGAIEGRRLTIDESSGGGILVQVESPEELPSVDQYLKETKDFIRGQKWNVLGQEAPRRVADRPVRIDRFAFDADVNKQKVRLEYAVLSQAEGGVTMAGRIPWNDRDDLGRDFERIVRTLTVTRRIEK